MNVPTPLRSLQAGHWFKLICGASFQHLPEIRNLTLVYALAGADCIDVAADPAVIAVAQEALTQFAQIRQHLWEVSARMPRSELPDWQKRLDPTTGPITDHARSHITAQMTIESRPWLMVSLNDGEDPHFRKATFDPATCPSDCPRPCVNICPTQAIQLQGVIESRCYGCGRCIPVCPLQHIQAQSYVSAPASLMPQLMAIGIDAVELHTQINRVEDFRRLWQALNPWLDQLKLVAISCPDGEGVMDYLWSLYETIAPLPCPLIWQTDGRPMSGDIGAGTTHRAIQFAQKVLAHGPPGYVQVAGGTNNSTVPKLQALGLLRSNPTQDGSIKGVDFHPLNILENTVLKNTTVPAKTALENTLHDRHWVAGVAYGSYARQWLAPILKPLETRPYCLEEMPLALTQAVARASELVGPLKSRSVTRINHSVYG